MATHRASRPSVRVVTGIRITLLGLALILPGSAQVAGQTITQIIDATGDGGDNTLVEPWGIAVDTQGNAYVAGHLSNNIFKIEPDGTVTEIMDLTGDGSGHTLGSPEGIAVDSLGNVYVIGFNSNNAFKIDQGGVITQIIDSSGDGGGNPLTWPMAVAVDGSGNVYVTGYNSDNVFKITPGGAITEIIDATGDGSGNSLLGPSGVSVDGSENVYVSGFNSHNAFKIEPGGITTQIIDSTGDGVNILNGPLDIAMDAQGNVYVSGFSSDNAFKIEPGGTTTQIIDSTGDGAGNTLVGPRAVATNATGDVFVSGYGSHNAFRITPGGSIIEIIDATGDGGGNVLDTPRDYGIDTDRFGNVYVTGSASNNAFKINVLECQVGDPAAILYADLSDWDGPGGKTIRAEDFKPQGTAINTVKVWGAYFDPQDLEDTLDGDAMYDCSGEVLDNFHVTVYNDGGGIPTTQVGNSTAIAVKAIESAPAFQTGAPGFDVPLWAINLALESPITGLTPGTCYWLEVANNTSIPLDNTCVWHWAVMEPLPIGPYAFTGTEEGYTLGGQRPVDMAFCLDVGFDPESCGIWWGACCSCGGAGCFVEALDDCEFVRVMHWDFTDPTCSVACDATWPIPETDCNTAVPVTDGVHVADTHCAPTDGPNPTPTEHDSTALCYDTWYTYTATCTGLVTIDMCQSERSFDSVVAVYRDSGDPKSCIVCPSDNGDLWPAGLASDDNCAGPANGSGGIVQGFAAKGDCLLIRVGGYTCLPDTSKGSGLLRISCEPSEPFPDCNGNNVPDADDIAGPTSTDCNSNYIPDECEPDEDCNANLVQDICDIAPPAPTSNDCNGNGVPDECDVGGASLDCNVNGEPDECDIADCTSGDPDFPGCDDCNANGVPDECDIAGATSDDVDLDEVPDECIGWTGGSSTDFSDGGNWDGDSPPGSGDPATIRGPGALRDEANAAATVAVTVDVDTEVASLRLLGDITLPEPDVTLNVTEVTQGDLTISGTGGLLARGANLFAAHDRVIDVPNGQVTIGEFGTYRASPSADNVSASLTAASVVIRRGRCDVWARRGEIDLDDSMSLDVSGDVTLVGAPDPYCGAAGSVLRDGMPESTQVMAVRACGTMLGSAASARGVIVPPKLNVCGTVPPLVAASMASSGAVLTVNGDLTLGPGAVESLTEANETEENRIILRGDFNNHSTYPSWFNWSEGWVILDGTIPQTFEVAGLDLGETSDGFLTSEDTLFESGEMHTNFSVGVLEVTPGTEVAFVNNFGNTVGAGDCTEALYVHELILGAGSTVTVDNCKIYPEVMTVGENVTFQAIGCTEFGEPCFDRSTAPEPERLPDPDPQEDAVSTKNRILSVAAGDAGRQQVIRVRAVSLPVPFDELDCYGGVCQAWYAGEPVQVCENSGQGINVDPQNDPPNGCGPAPGVYTDHVCDGDDTTHCDSDAECEPVPGGLCIAIETGQDWFWAAPLVCDTASAHRMDWTSLANYCKAPNDERNAHPCDEHCAPGGGTCNVDISVCEGGDNAGEPCCGSGSCGVLPVVHLYHEAVVPSHMAAGAGPIDMQAVYDVQVVEGTCSLTAERNYSPALRLFPAGWSDIVTDCVPTANGYPCGEPDGTIGVVTDVVALLSKFTNSTYAVQKTRAELTPCNVDFKIAITDVLQCLNAFQGGDYEDTCGTGQCGPLGLCKGGPDHGSPCTEDADCSFDPCAPGPTRDAGE